MASKSHLRDNQELPREEREKKREGKFLKVQGVDRKPRRGPLALGKLKIEPLKDKCIGLVLDAHIS